MKPQCLFICNKCKGRVVKSFDFIGKLCSKCGEGKLMYRMTVKKKTTK